MYKIYLYVLLKLFKMYNNNSIYILSFLLKSNFKNLIKPPRLNNSVL